MVHSMLEFWMKMMKSMNKRMCHKPILIFEIYVDTL